MQDTGIYIAFLHTKYLT